ncbi:Alg14-domain-containing protein [Trichodelitschia bisporula]|uniref:UDP-N-acetylglucosamine transferase subunit ALG14 n=1 Tax=Trichodelitschia bisporula TaxID=703511 RepID=A0A6G1HT45_9PEZI|nr:Alg14-domain-containing protein [Trichodelitschia bisporula]
MLLPTWGSALIALLIALGILTTLRLLFILPPYRPRPRSRKRSSPTHLLVVLGSGGHTAEMLVMLRDLDPQTYARRTWVVSSGDAFSARKAEEFESDLRQKALDANCGNYEIVTIPRARRVHQSLLSTPVSSLQCLWSCIRLLRRVDVQRPDLILSNGPGTGVIVVLASLVLRFFDWSSRPGGPGSTRLIYVESWARVKRLSLSGKLLLRLVDRFLVQWESLEGAGGRAEFHGVLV